MKTVLRLIINDKDIGPMLETCKVTGGIEEYVEHSVGTDGATIEDGVTSEAINNDSDNEDVQYCSEETEGDAHSLDIASDGDEELIEARNKLLSRKGKMKLNEGDQNEVDEPVADQPVVD